MPYNSRGVILMKVHDFTGHKIGMLTVIERAGTTKHGNALWKCVCDCGNETFVPGGALNSQRIKSCGCLRKNDLTNRRYGKVLVVERLEADEHGDTLYRCKCDCGNEFFARQSNLVRGHSLSCGKIGCKKTNKTHGLRSTELYKKYYDIRTRCNNKNNASYGGRGIKLCEEWSGENGFLRFAEWSFANGYKEGLSLDRIDVNGNYEPSNCRWVTWEIQAKNKRPLPQNTTGVAGVYHKDGKYAANISVNGKRYHLGTFTTIEEAAMARRKAEEQYWGWTLNSD